MTDFLLQATLLTVLLGLGVYRVTKAIVEDDILEGWRERHGIGIDGYRCGDTWTREWPEDASEGDCQAEMSCEQAYRDAVQQSGGRPWPMSWLSLLCTKVFWVRAFSCNQCASVWVSGVLATVAVLALAVATGNWTWLLWWPLVAPAVAGLAARLFL
jgi:hypothetical protein